MPFLKPPHLGYWTQNLLVVDRKEICKYIHIYNIVLYWLQCICHFLSFYHHCLKSLTHYNSRNPLPLRPTFILGTRLRLGKQSQAGTSSHRTGHKIASIVSVGANTGPAALLVYALSGSICQESCQGSGQESSVTANLQMRELPLMHIKPTPPARRISHPAFLVSGILIKRADRKPLSSPCRWIIQRLSPPNSSCRWDGHAWRRCIPPEPCSCVREEGERQEKEQGLAVWGVNTLGITRYVC